MGVLAGEVCGGNLKCFWRQMFEIRTFGGKCGFKRENILAGKYKL